MRLEADIPEKFLPFLEPHRYKIAYGGRGGGKSHTIAKLLLLKGLREPLRILCAREIQKSIRDSVHKLLTDQIKEMQLEGYYEVQNSVIRHRFIDTEFTFDGLHHNVANIKSKEGIDIVWCEEAQSVSKTSWETLIPTIRRPNSEIWVSFNPSLREDETYQRMVVNPPTDAAVIRINWNDNPWFPEVLEQERLDLLARDPDAYDNVYEGNPKAVVEGAVYAQQLKASETEGRITSVPYMAGKAVHTFWDIGRRDKTAIIFAQQVGLDFHIIDFYENRGFHLDHYIKKLQEKPYVYGDDWLPHDAFAETVASKRTIAQQMRDIGRVVKQSPKLGTNKQEGINALRSLFNRLYFDKDRCAELLQNLRHYRYEVDEDTGQFSLRPLHDEASHAADAAGYMALSLKEEKKPRAVTAKPYRGASAWMG